MNTLTLRDLLAESTDLEEKLIELAGELTPEIEHQLTILENRTPEKVDNYIRFCRRLEMEIGGLSAQAKRYKQAVDSYSNLLVRRKEHIKQLMIEHGLKELRGNNESYMLTKGQKAVEITSLQALPQQFVKETIDRKPDRDKIREELEIGGIVSGAELRDTYVLRAPKINKGINK